MLSSTPLGFVTKGMTRKHYIEVTCKTNVFDPLIIFRANFCSTERNARRRNLCQALVQLLSSSNNSCDSSLALCQFYVSALCQSLCQVLCQALCQALCQDLYQALCHALIAKMLSGQKNITSPWGPIQKLEGIFNFYFLFPNANSKKKRSWYFLLNCQIFPLERK